MSTSQSGNTTTKEGNEQRAREVVDSWQCTDISLVEFVAQALTEAEQRGYLRGFEDAAKVLDGWAQGTLEDIRKLKEPSHD